MLNEMQIASSPSGSGGYTKVGTVTIPNNTTDEVTLTFDEPITQFVAIYKNLTSGKITPGFNKCITMNTSIDGIGEFMGNWRQGSPSSSDSGSGITLSADGKTLTLKQPRNYYAGDYFYFAWA